MVEVEAKKWQNGLGDGSCVIVKRVLLKKFKFQALILKKLRAFESFFFKFEFEQIIM